MENYVITIGRRFGSGGRELGRILAERLGIDFYDKELLLEAAKQAGLSPEFFERNDERVPQFLSGIIPFSFGVNPMPWYAGTTSISDDSLHHVQSDFIRAIAAERSCIIVGRSADYVLRDNPRMISVFLTAPMEKCVERIMRRSDCHDPEEARRMAERINKLRANYYDFYTDKQWGDASSYDLCIDTSRLTMSQVADIVIAYLRARLNQA